MEIDTEHCIKYLFACIHTFVIFCKAFKFVFRIGYLKNAKIDQ